MRKYASYKDSGINWFKEIPNHWSLLRLKDISKALSSGATPSSGNMAYYENGSINWLNTGDLNDGLILKTSKQLNQVVFSDYPNLKIQKKGTLVIAMYGATIGKMGILNIDATTNQACCCINLKNNLNTKFFFYQLLSNKQNIISLSVGGTQPNVSQSILGFVKIPTPPFSEQTAIAQYLDTKTQAIDKKVNLLEKKISYYKELRKSIINETVTKGLDKTVKLKDSGIDCIGQIPEHWEVKRLKEIIRKDITDGPHETPEFVNDGIPFISVDGIQDGELTFNNCRLISNKDFIKYSKKVKIERDDIFIGKAASTGKIARVKVDFDFTVWSPIAVVKIKDIINATYVEYALKSEISQYQIVILSTHNTQSNIAMKDIPLIIMAIPPTLQEQAEIATYLVHKTQTIDKIVGNIQNQITALKELRKTLINDVVTGKIKVVE